MNVIVMQEGTIQKQRDPGIGKSRNKEEKNKK